MKDIYIVRSKTQIYGVFKDHEKAESYLEDLEKNNPELKLFIESWVLR